MFQIIYLIKMSTFLEKKKNLSAYSVKLLLHDMIVYDSHKYTFYPLST